MRPPADTGAGVAWTPPLPARWDSDRSYALIPAADAVIDSLIKLQNYRITRYMADTIVVEGDSQTEFLREEAFVERTRHSSRPTRSATTRPAAGRCGGSSAALRAGNGVGRRRMR